MNALQKRMLKERMDYVYLNAGDLVFTDTPVLAETNLGSCVAVTLFSPRTGYAACSHSIFPSSSGSLSIPNHKRFHYTDLVVHHMLNRFAALGIGKLETEVKLIGGASILSVRSDVSDKNVKIAKMIIAKHGLEIKSEDTGGSSSRLMVFNSKTGDIFVRRMKKQQESA